jgi:hypothetical protein
VAKSAIFDSLIHGLINLDPKNRHEAAISYISLKNIRIWIILFLLVEPMEKLAC